MGFGGRLLYISLSLVLLSSKQSLRYISELKPDAYGALVALLGIGALALTSEGMGFLFSSIHIFYWNFIRSLRHEGRIGYSAEWDKLEYDLQSYIERRYSSALPKRNRKNVKKDKVAAAFFKKLKSYPIDVVQSFFFHQAPDGIIGWVIRRYTIFFTGASIAVATVLGVLVAWLLIWKLSLAHGAFTLVSSVMFLLVVAFILANGRYARRQAIQMMELWRATRIDARMKKIAADVLGKENARKT